ncbi:31299_t:CDS:1, partial [Racocetra persica]
GYISQLGSNIKKLEKLQEQEENKDITRILTDLVDQIVTIDFNFQKFKEISDQKVKMYLDNMKDIKVLPQRLK